MPALLRDVQPRSNEGRIPSNGYHTSPKFVSDSLGVVRRAYTKNALHSITSQQNNSNHQASDLVIRAIMPPDCEQYSSPSLYRLCLCSYVRGGCEFVGRFSRRYKVLFHLSRPVYSTATPDFAKLPPCVSGSDLCTQVGLRWQEFHPQKEWRRLDSAC